MKKTILLILMSVFILPLFSNQANASTYSNIKMYLGDNVELTKNDSIYQSNSIINEGLSKVYHVLEIGNVSNEFVRLAKFDSNLSHNYTAVNVALYQTTMTSNISLSIDYRFYEGNSIYSNDDVVVTFKLGNSIVNCTYEDLIWNYQTTFDWQTLNLTMELENEFTVDKLTILYHFPDNTTYNSNDNYLDIDNISVKQSEDECVIASGLELGKATTSHSLILDFDSNVMNYMILSHDETNNYTANTSYSNQEETNFNCGDSAVMITRIASSGIYRGSSSVKNKESDIYAVYDSKDDNTFLRVGNFNGAQGVTSTGFYIHHYNNKTNEMYTISKNYNITVTFKYRLYLSDESKININPNDTILSLNPSNLSGNKTGSISLDELIVNDKNDATWRTLTCVLRTKNTSSKYIKFDFFTQTESSYNSETFIDIDDMVVNIDANQQNYAYLNGTFESLVPRDNLVNELNGNIFYNDKIGQNASRYNIGNNDYCMKLDKNQTFSLNLNWDNADTINLKFDVLTENAKIKLYFGGHNGETLEIYSGESKTENNYSILWTKDIVWHCQIYFTRVSKYSLYSLDILNISEENMLIDNIFIGQVTDICNTAGNYQNYYFSLQNILNNYHEEQYKISIVKRINLVLSRADKINEYSSESKMNTILNELNSLLVVENQKSDISILNNQIDIATYLIENNSEQDFTPNSWVKLVETLKMAKQLTDEHSQDEIDSQCNELSNAINSLEKFENENSDTIPQRKRRFAEQAEKIYLTITTFIQENDYMVFSIVILVITTILSLVIYKRRKAKC